MRFKCNRFSCKRLKLVSRNKNLNGHSHIETNQVWNNANCSMYRQTDLQVTNGTQSAIWRVRSLVFKKVKTRKIWSAVVYNVCFTFLHITFSKKIFTTVNILRCVFQLCLETRTVSKCSFSTTGMKGGTLRNIRSMFFSLWHAELYTGTAKGSIWQIFCTFRCQLANKIQFERNFCLPLIRKSVSVAPLATCLGCTESINRQRSNMVTARRE